MQVATLCIDSKVVRIEIFHVENIKVKQLSSALLIHSVASSEYPDDRRSQVEKYISTIDEGIDRVGMSVEASRVGANGAYKDRCINKNKEEK